MAGASLGEFRLADYRFVVYGHYLGWRVPALLLNPFRAVTLDQLCEINSASKRLGDCRTVRGESVSRQLVSARRRPMQLAGELVGMVRSPLSEMPRHNQFAGALDCDKAVGISVGVDDSRMRSDGITCEATR